MYRVKIDSDKNGHRQLLAYVLIYLVLLTLLISDVWVLLGWLCCSIACFYYCFSELRSSTLQAGTILLSNKGLLAFSNEHKFERGQIAYLIPPNALFILFKVNWRAHDQNHSPPRSSYVFVFAEQLDEADFRRLNRIVIGLKQGQ